MPKFKMCCRRTTTTTTRMQTYPKSRRCHNPSKLLKRMCRNLILIIASAIGGIFALIIMLGFTNPRIENKGLSFFLSAIVGILIGVLVYLTFWFGVLAFILLMVLWFVIPKPLRKGIKKGV